MKNYELIIERRQPPCGGKQTKLYDQHLKETGVTCQQFSTLECVRAMEPVSVTELSRKMRLDRFKEMLHILNDRLN